MVKKMFAVLIALLSCIMLSVGAFAAIPSFDNSVSGSKEISQIQCINWLCAESGVEAETLSTAYTWAQYDSRNCIVAYLPDSENGFGYQFWYDETGTFTVDMYSGTNVSRIAGNPTPSSPDTPASDPGSVGKIIDDVTAASSGIFQLGTGAFDLMLSNPVCFLFLGSGFCFTAIGLACKALRSSKKA